MKAHFPELSFVTISSTLAKGLTLNPMRTKLKSEAAAEIGNPWPERHAGKALIIYVEEDDRPGADSEAKAYQRVFHEYMQLEVSHILCFN